MHLIRRALPAEATALSELALQSKAHWGYDASFLEKCKQELTLSEADLAAHEAYVLTRADTLLGFYVLERLDVRRLKLSFLFVRPSCIGQGHGRALIEHAKRTAAELGARTMVIASDPDAERFYLTAGARRVGVRASSSISGRLLPLLELSV